MTKEQQKNEIVKLSLEITILKEEDLRLRKVLSDLLKSYTIKSPGLYGVRGEQTKELKVLSWEGIAFRIGELNADANYSILLQEKDRINRHNLYLEGKIEELKTADDE